MQNTQIDTAIEALGQRLDSGEIDYDTYLRLVEESLNEHGIPDPVTV